MKMEHQRTNRAIADAMKELMQQTPLEEISVGEIIRQAKVSRNTFYYHFKDKYDLVNWIFASEAEPLTEVSLSPANWQQLLYTICRYLRANQAFYTNALRLTGQNSLQSYLVSYFTRLLKERISHLCRQRGRPISAQEADFAARFYSCAIVGLMVQWAADGMKEDFTCFADPLRGVLSGSYLEEVFEPPALLPIPVENSDKI